MRCNLLEEIEGKLGQVVGIRGFEEMGHSKNKKGLLNKENFKQLALDKGRWLRHLSMKKAADMEESLLSSSLIWEWRKNFSQDNPVCLRMLLNKKCHRSEKI